MSSRPPLQGFNHNVRHGARVYHVQTEDSGLDHPHLFTHLYYRGLILASARTDYSELAQQPGHETAVRKLMQEQHKALMRQLRHGAFDEKIAALLGTEDAAEASAAPEGEAGAASAAEAAAAPADRVLAPEFGSGAAAVAAATAPELARDGLEGAPTDPAALEAQRAAPETPQALVIDAIPAMPSGAVAADQPTAHSDSSARPDVADTQRITAPDAAPPARDGTRRPATRPAPAAPAGTTQPQESRSRSGRGLEGALEWARGSGSASELEAEPTLVQRIELHAPAEPEEHPQGAAARATPSVGAQTRPRLAPDAAVGQGVADRRAAQGAAPAARGPSATHPSPTPLAGGPRAPRPSGTYAVPTWARASTETPPTGRNPPSPAAPVESAAPRAASTPQRYTAPSAKSAGRSRRATGSYAPLEGAPAPASGGAAALPSATQVATRAAVPNGGGVYRISTLGGARPSGAVAARGGGQSMPAVVARPAVVVDRGLQPAQPGRAPGSAAVTGLPPAAARAVHPRSTPLPPPAAIGTVPPKRPTASPPATPSSATNPRPFGADLISERSLDEVILQYLSEENDGGR